MHEGYLDRDGAAVEIAHVSTKRRLRQLLVQQPMASLSGEGVVNKENALALR